MEKQKVVRKTGVSKPSLKTTEATAASASSGKKSRTRVGNVRGLILELLASGPMSSSALVAQGKFSPASVFLNMKSLKQEGRVTAARNGREVLFSLAGAAGAAAPTAAKPPKKAVKGKPVKTPSSSHGLVLAYVPSELHSALSGLTHRLAPVEGLAEKLNVLDTLRGTLPAPIAAVLAAVASDLQRMAPSDSPVPF
ncbi:MAG: hypothetical protein NVS9B10_02070 [Nevskia sp.]